MAINAEEMFYLNKKNQSKKKVSELDLIAAREYFRKNMQEYGIDRKIELIIEKSIPTSDNDEIRIRIYYPSKNLNKPIMLFCHGGGFVMGDLKSYDSDCRNLSAEIDCIVVLVEYRLAPEYQHPVAIEDCYTVANWILDNHTIIGGDITNFFIGGDSAGGYIAAKVISKFIESGRPNSFKMQLLMYPFIEFLSQTPSRLLYSDNYNITSATLEWCCKQYFPNHKILENHSLLKMEQNLLKVFPKTLIMTAEYDPLRDEAKEFSIKLNNAGVPVIYKQFDGTIHGFMSMPALLKTTHEGYKFISNAFATMIG